MFEPPLDSSRVIINTMYYFAYGSNMNEEQMSRRCPDAQLFGKGVLRDYRLDFTISAPERWNGAGCADVVEIGVGEVWGLLYIVTPTDEGNLDRAEGPRYRKIIRTIHAEGGQDVRAFLYEVIDKAPPKKPSVQYLNPIKNAALKHQFPESYVNFLNAIEVAN